MQCRYLSLHSCPRLGFPPTVLAKTANNMPRYTTPRELALARRAMGEPNVVIPPPPKPRKNEESIAQCAVIAWWATACKTYGVPECLLFSVPNDGLRRPKEAYFQKLRGLRAGVCDLMLLVARGPFNGLLIEMKAAKGIVSDAQEEFMRSAASMGYRAVVCRSAEAAKQVIHEYLSL